MLSAYLFLLSGNNRDVGFVQGVNGSMQLLVAFPAGWLADHMRRDRVLRIAAALGAIAGCALLTALVLQLDVTYLFLAAALLGVYRGFNNPALESIYADSVPTGQSALYTAKHVVMQIAFSFGPVLSIVLFTFLGDSWKVSECRIVLLTGLGLMLAPIALMCFFDDDLTLGKASEAIRIPKSESLLENPTEENEDRARGCCYACGCSPRLLVPLVITSSDMLGALASGMTLKFFALFFMQQCQLQPTVVSTLGAVSSLAVTAASIGAQRASLWAGRAQVTLVTRLADIVLLCMMAYAPTNTRTAKAALMAMHLARLAIANCTRPLLRSLLMDYVPKHHRGKVNALDSVRTLSWSGSAALGGLLIQAYGFQTTFLITAVIKLASWIPLIVLMCLVEDGVCTQAAKQRSHPAQIEHIASGNDRTLRAPLLAAGDQEGQCNSLDHVHQRTDHERTGYPTRVDCHAANAAGANHAQESS